MKSVFSRRISIFCLITLSVLFLVQVSVWITRAALSRSGRLTDWQIEVVLNIATFPRRVVGTFEELAHIFGLVNSKLLLETKKFERPHWERKFPAAEDGGYLLFSGLYAGDKYPNLKLIRVADGKIIKTWNPDWSFIAARSSPVMRRAGIGPTNLVPVNPVLLPDGSVVFNTGYALVKLNRCRLRPEWVLPAEFHHSVDVDRSGHIWTASVANDGYAWNAWISSRFRDDSIAEVSTGGTILRNISIAGILVRNGMRARLIGSQGYAPNDDPIHINQISVAATDSEHWKAGDLLLSLRHLSAVMIYRPSTDKIIWYKAGPWINQHSVAFWGDHKISVFNNNVVAYLSSESAFLSPASSNQVMVYDFDFDTVSQPFAELLEKSKPATMTAGRAQLLSDGGLFVEETEGARHLRFSAEKLIWSRVNDYDDKHLGAVAWSRYLAAEDVEPVLKVLATQPCETDR